ncbi:MAG: nucleotidyltransferase family protein [Blastocatellales bacterium]
MFTINNFRVHDQSEYAVFSLRFLISGYSLISAEIISLLASSSSIQVTHQFRRSIHWFSQPLPSTSLRRTRLSLPEDLLIYLCAHGAKHAWERLIWLADVAGLIHKHSNLDWDGVRDLAVEQRCGRVLLLGLRLARDVVGVTPAAQMEEIIRRDTESRRLAETGDEDYPPAPS